MPAFSESERNAILTFYKMLGEFCAKAGNGGAGYCLHCCMRTLCCIKPLGIKEAFVRQAIKSLEIGRECLDGLGYAAALG